MRCSTPAGILMGITSASIPHSQCSYCHSANSVCGKVTQVCVDTHDDDDDAITHAFLHALIFSAQHDIVSTSEVVVSDVQLW